MESYTHIMTLRGSLFSLIQMERSLQTDVKFLESSGLVGLPLKAAILEATNRAPQRWSTLRITSIH